MVGEKGWWEKDPEAEAEEAETEVERPEVEYDPSAGGPAILFLMLIGSIVLSAYIERRISASDSLCVQHCCGFLFWILYWT